MSARHSRLTTADHATHVRAFRAPHPAVPRLGAALWLEVASTRRMLKNGTLSYTAASLAVTGAITVVFSSSADWYA